VSKIPGIQTGLGNLTPDVWRRMSNSIYSTEENAGERPPASSPNIPIAPFPALITGYNLIDPTDQDFENPRRRFYYQWNEVSVRFTKNNGVTVELFEGSRTSSTPGQPDFLPAINGAEVGQPTQRESSILGVRLDNYPERVAMMPAVHDSTPVHSGGTLNTAQVTDGPLVMMSLIPCVIDEDPGSGDDRQFPLIGMFYSAIKFDGVCDE